MRARDYTAKLRSGRAVEHNQKDERRSLVIILILWGDEIQCEVCFDFARLSVCLMTDNFALLGADTERTPKMN